MPQPPSRIRVLWDNDAHTCIRLEYDRGWTWEEYHTIVETVAEMLQEVHHPVPYINVYNPGARMPNNNPLPHLNRMVRVVPDNVIVLVTRDPVTRGEINAYVHMLGYDESVNYWCVPTLEAAREHVEDFLRKKISQPQPETK